MTNFINRSNYSNWTSPHHSTQLKEKSPEHKRTTSTGDHFFKTTKDNKNASLIGYTKINPLVSSVETNALKEKKISEYLDSKSP